MSSKAEKSVESVKDPLSQAKENFIEGAGRISASLLGMLNRVCGQIYALLFLSVEPLSLDDIVEALGVSKGNVSINIRILEDYQLVRKVWVKGTRRDYYAAIDSLPTQIIKEFFDKIRRNIQDSLDMINDCCQVALQGKGSGRGVDVEFVLQRLKLIQSFYQNANTLFETLYSGRPVNTGVLKPILNGSAK